MIIITNRKLVGAVEVPDNFAYIKWTRARYSYWILSIHDSDTKWTDIAEYGQLSYKARKELVVWLCRCIENGSNLIHMPQTTKEVKQLAKGELS